MIYTNVKLWAEEKEMDWGSLHHVTLGEEGRGRSLISLPCPKDIDAIEAGMHNDLSIGTTKSGRPRINKWMDDKLFMILSAEGGYTRRGCGTVQVLKKDFDRVNVLTRGNGADGDAGRIGYWDCMVVEAPLTDMIIRVRTSGAGYGTPSDFYFILDGAVYHCTTPEVFDLCDSLGIEMPFTIDRGKLLGSEWEIL